MTRQDVDQWPQDKERRALLDRYGRRIRSKARTEENNNRSWQCGEVIREVPQVDCFLVGRLKVRARDGHAVGAYDQEFAAVIRYCHKGAYTGHERGGELGAV